jgi:hypothetical protein
VKSFVPWCTNFGNRPVGVVRLDDGCLGLRVQLASGERVTMPLAKITFKRGGSR